MSNATVFDLINFGNPIFETYIFYSSILILKMMIMSVMTARFRLTKRIFANPEDAATLDSSEVRLDDPEIERVRRAHLNDVENIYLFFAVAFLYILTDPSAFIAKNLFRIYVLARLVHTFVYAIVVIPQPSRAIAWFVGYAITGFMALVVLCTFFSI